MAKGQQSCSHPEPKASAARAPLCSPQHQPYVSALAPCQVARQPLHRNCEASAPIVQVRQQAQRGSQQVAGLRGTPGPWEDTPVLSHLPRAVKNRAEERPATSAVRPTRGMSKGNCFLLAHNQADFGAVAAEGTPLMCLKATAEPHPERRPALGR